MAPRPLAEGEVIRGYRLLRLPLALGLPVSRGLLVKRHESRDPEERAAAERTLFVTHLDNFATEAQLTRCFSSSFGPVEKVIIKSVEKKAGKAEQRADAVRPLVNFARVIFKDASSLDKALAAATGRLDYTAVLPPPGSELKEQLKSGGAAAYRDPVELRREVDNWMANYDAKEEEKVRLARESQVDDDGFTKVISGVTKAKDDEGNTFRVHAAARAAPNVGAFSEPIKGGQNADILAAAQENISRKRKKSKEMPDFYRFQMREKKRDELLELRKQKAEDTEKVEYMKKKKKFKANHGL